MFSRSYFYSANITKCSCFIAIICLFVVVYKCFVNVECFVERFTATLAMDIEYIVYI